MSKPKIPMQEEYKQQYETLSPEQKAQVDKMRERVQSVLDTIGDAGPAVMWGVGEFLWDDIKKLIAGALTRPADEAVWTKVYGAIQGTQALESVIFSVIPRPEEDEDGNVEMPQQQQPPQGTPGDGVFG